MSRSNIRELMVFGDGNDRWFGYGGEYTVYANGGDDEIWTGSL